MRRILYTLPIMVLALLSGVFLWALNPERDPSALPSPLIDKPVPSFRLPILGDPLPGNRRTMSEADLKGGVTVFNVFASWCIPCRVEHPMLKQIARSGKARMVGLNYKDKPEDAARWLKELGNPYALIGADRNGRAAIEWGVYGVPETFIIDHSGRIRYKHVGPIHPGQYESIIRPLIERLTR